MLRITRQTFDELAAVREAVAAEVQASVTRLLTQALPTAGEPEYDKLLDCYVITDSNGGEHLGMTREDCRATWFDDLERMADHLKRCPTDADLLAREPAMLKDWQDRPEMYQDNERE